MFQRVSHDNGQWQKLITEWDESCSSYGEDLADYATASLSVLQPLAEQTQRPAAGVFAVQHEGSYSGLCQLNAAFLPGYSGKVLRVRHIVHAPRFDYDDDVNVDDYVQFLGELFIGVLEVSEGEMAAPHIKIHFKSPTERAFFEKFKDALEEREPEIKLSLKGAWLYMTKQRE